MSLIKHIKCKIKVESQAKTGAKIFPHWFPGVGVLVGGVGVGGKVGDGVLLEE